MDSNDLRALALAIETGSITSAAAALDLQASSVSRAIRRLETEFGAELVEREPRGVVATEAGKLMIAHYQDNVASLDALKSRLDDLRALRTGVVGVATGEAFARGLIEKVVQDFSTTYPSLSVDVHVCDLATMQNLVVNSVCDVGLTFDVGYHSELTVVTRAPCPVVLAAPAGHPILRTAGPIRMEDLAQARVALLHATSGLRRLVKAAEEEAGVHLSFALRSNSVHVLINYVCCGLGVALVPASAVVGGDMRERYGIEIRPIESRALQGAEVSLFVRRGRTLSAGSRLMLESISRHIHEILV